MAEADAARAPAAAAPSATSLAGRANNRRDGRAAGDGPHRAVPPLADKQPHRASPRASIAAATPAVSRGKESRIGTIGGIRRSEESRTRGAGNGPAAAPPVAQSSDVRPQGRASAQRSRAIARRPRPGRWRWARPRPIRADPARAIDVDAWIVRIRKLHDEGKLADAAKELLALRAAIPDADGRLPPELRAWAATVKP